MPANNLAAKTPRPSANSIVPVAIAAAVILGWSVSLALALQFASVPNWRVRAPHVLLMAWLQFLYCGLFITAHDACHGTAAPGAPRLNLWLGRISAALYACFGFAHLRSQHLLHHAHRGSDKDPDFHGAKPWQHGFWPWTFRFFWHYVTVRQMLMMTAVSQVLLNGLKIPAANVYLFWVIPAVGSALQLFFFGTYLPHRRSATQPFADQHQARNLAYPYWLSFVSCYHFGYHHVHHSQPRVPWFQLPQAYAKRPQQGAHQAH